MKVQWQVSILPDQFAPIVRNAPDGAPELAMGMPSPAQYGGAPVTNIRNVSSLHWRGWPGRRNRCIASRRQDANPVRA